MKNFAGLLTVLSLIAAFCWYAPLIVRKRVNPAPATWILGALAMNLSMVSYHAIPGRTVIENVTLYASAFQIASLLGLMAMTLWRHDGFRLAFDRVQKACLSVMVLALLYWATHRDAAHVTFYTTQTLLVVAYVATILKALQRRTAFDSIGHWGLIVVSSLVGSIPALLMASPYGLANSARAIISSTITVSILIYFDRKGGWSRWKDEITTIVAFYGAAKHIFRKIWKERKDVC